jgi:hypothetical protein
MDATRKNKNAKDEDKATPAVCIIKTAIFMGVVLHADHSSIWGD